MLMPLALGVAACDTRGDFGRRKPSFFSDQIVPAARTAFREVRGVLVSSYDYTDDEAYMRSLGETLQSADRTPSVDRPLESAMERAGVRESTYEERRRITHNTGLSVHEDHPPSRRTQALALIIQLEIEQVQTFGRVVERVYDADARRRDALLHNGEVSGNDIQSSMGRMRENRRVVRQTILALRNRIDDYRLEVRRTQLEYPDVPADRVADAVERLAKTVSRLERRVRVWPFPEDAAHEARRGHKVPAASNSDLLGG